MVGGDNSVLANLLFSVRFRGTWREAPTLDAEVQGMYLLAPLGAGAFGRAAGGHWTCASSDVRSTPGNLCGLHLDASPVLPGTAVGRFQTRCKGIACSSLCASFLTAPAPGNGTATVLIESAAVRQQHPLKESIMVYLLLTTRSGPANIHPFFVPHVSLLSSPCKVPSSFSTTAC